MKKEKMNSGITIISLVVTIIVLLILAGITIRLASNNGIIDKTKIAKEIEDKTDVIEIAQLDIMKVRVKNGGNLSEQDLIDILTSSDYHTEGTLSDNDEESVLDKILTTKDGQYQIKVSEIYDGKLTKSSPSLTSLKSKIEKQSGDCMIDEEGKIIPINVWRYVITGDDTCALVGTGDDYDYPETNAYSGRIINGVLEYSIPVYIKVEQKSYRVNELGEYCLCFLQIENFEIPNYIEKLGRCFMNGNNSTTSLIIPETVNDMNSMPFAWSSLEQVTLPNNMNSIPYGLFYDCRSLERVNIPDGVETIEDYAFFRCNNLKSITIPNGVKEIKRWAFYKCNKLQQLILPSSLERIGETAFAECTGISTLDIPKNIRYIEQMAFSGWKNTQTINVNYKQSELPSGYSSGINGLWSYECNATINYLPEE